MVIVTVIVSVIVMVIEVHYVSLQCATPSLTGSEITVGPSPKMFMYAVFHFDVMWTAGFCSVNQEV